MHNRNFNILTYRWHVSHQYELWKLGYDITLVHGAGTAACDSWAYDQRPFPKNAMFQDIERVNPQKYDLAILHFDENVLHPELCNGMETSDWGDTFKTMFALTANIPRVAVCHGTPQFLGQYDPKFHGTEPVSIYEDSRRELVDFLGDTFVVCNSHQAEKEWGFSRSTTIWHGFSPDEYLFGTHERDCLAPMSSSIKKRAYYMGQYELEQLKALLEGHLAIEYTTSPDPQGFFPNKQAWAITKYKNYRREIGRYSFYLNTTLRSPMPRSRGEAMMEGVIPLTLRNHDTDLFIQNGINGYSADTVDELADFAMFLKNYPRTKEKISIAARESAIVHFNNKRYLSEWAKLIAGLV